MVDDDVPIVVLVNPSSSGFTAGILRQVMAVLGNRAAARWPTNRDDTVDMAATAGAAGATVVAMGGDGMVHHVARGVVGTAGRLAIVPVGTTNVLARLLGLPQDPVGAAGVVVDGRTKHIPVGIAAWGSGTGERLERPVLFSLGAGWDAEVVASAEAEPYRKATGGVRLYLRSTIAQLRREIGRLPDLDVSAPEPAICGPAIAVQVQLWGAYTFAGPARFRLGEPQEGYLVVANWRRMRAAALLPITKAALGSGGAGTHPDIDVAAVTSVSVEASRPVRLQIDGEPLGTFLGLDVAVDPRGLHVVVPSEDAHEKRLR